MMKLLKRFGAIFLTIAMIMSFGAVTVSATDPTGSLTINNLDGTASKGTFNAYQIVTSNAGNMVVNTTYRDAVITALNSVLPSTFQLTSPDDVTILKTISGLNASQAAAFAMSLNNAIKSTVSPPAPTVVSPFTALNYGYYLIVQTGASTGSVYTLSDPFVVSIQGDQKVNIKASKANIEKKIVFTDDPANVQTNFTQATTPADLADTSTAAVGDYVHFRSLSTIPTYADATGPTLYTVTDTMCNGLYFDPSSVNVSVLNMDGTAYTGSTKLISTDYTLNADTYSHGFNVKFTNLDKIKIWGNSGCKILITYAATLGQKKTDGTFDTSKVSFGSTGNPNSVKLTYDTTTTPDDTVITYTTKLVINKTDGNGNKLSGAQFMLSGTDTYGHAFSSTSSLTDSSGVATFSKIRSGTYTLTETIAPAGYSTMNPTTINVGAVNKEDNSSISNTNYAVTESGNPAVQKDFLATWSGTGALLTFSFCNDKLSTTITDTSFKLPGSGGMGTTLFTAGGILLIAIAGTSLVIYNKKRKMANH